MKRLVLLFVAALVAVPLLVTATPAGAKKPDNCDLLTKRQASTILGYKVVKTQIEREKSTGAEQCEWRTNKYWSKRFKDSGAPFKLQVTTQPLTDEVEKSIQTLEADKDTEAAPELGERVMFDKFHNLIAVVGPVVLQIEVANWSTADGASLDDDVVGPETAAAEILIPLFEDAAK